MADHKKQQARFARACTACYQKKIRCNVASGKVPCSSCELHGSACIPRTRKYKHSPASTEGPSHVNGPNDGLQSVMARSSSRTQKNVTDFNEVLTNQDGREGLDLDLASIPSPLPPAPAQVDYEDYYGPSIPTHQDTGDDLSQSQHTPRAAESNRAVLQLFNAFDLPSAAWRSSLLENFMTYAQPLMPIVELQWLEPKQGYTVPITLLKAALLAGARTTNTQPPFSCDEYYSAIKAMMLYRPEQNPITTMVVSCLLGWYNQASAYRVTTDSSSSWLRFASNIAYQVGLHKELQSQTHAGYRRRLWWTLVARDCQISAGQGRPRIFNLVDCSVKPISIQDFGDGEPNADIFVAHVRLCLILGDLCDLYRRREMTPRHSDNIRERLFWWMKTLAPNMQYFSLASSMKPSSDNLMLRQLFVIYFATVTIQYRTDWSTQVVHPVAVIASSFMVSLLEGFLARDELQRLPTMFCFYAISAAVPQFVATNYEHLTVNAEADLQIVQQSLKALSKRWPSSESVLRHFETLRDSRARAGGSRLPPNHSWSDDLLLFENFNPAACRSWSLFADDCDAGGRQVPLMVPPRTPGRELSSTRALSPSSLRPTHAVPDDTRQSVPTLGVVGLPWGNQHTEWETPLNYLDTGTSVDFPDTMGSWLFSGDVFGDADYGVL